MPGPSDIPATAFSACPFTASNRELSGHGPDVPGPEGLLPHSRQLHRCAPAKREPVSPSGQNLAESLRLL